MIYMVVEQFHRGPEAVYQRFRERGRQMPDGLTYISSWVTHDGAICYQVMECDDRTLLDQWMANWNDIVEFEVIPVMTSTSAMAKWGPK